MRLRSPAHSVPHRLVIALVLSAALLAGGARAAAPTVTFVVMADGTLAVESGGQTVNAASPILTLPAGAYQVVITDEASDVDDPVHMLEVSGPGVALSTDLQGGDDKTELYSETFAPQASYVFRDADIPALRAVTFQTSATSVAPTTTMTAAPSPSTGRTSNDGVVGAAAKRLLRGTLHATVRVSGAVALTTKAGLPAGRLVAGRYLVQLDDLDRSAGARLVSPTARVTQLSGAGFTGSRSVTIALVAGRWSYMSAPGGAVRHFTVVAS